MHASFISGLKDLIIHRFDLDVWLDIVESAGFERNINVVGTKELADERAIKLYKSAVKRLHFDDRRFGEIFGHYWINTYAKEKYFAFFNAAKNVAELINQLNLIHTKLTENLENPAPPVFELNWESKHTAIITYRSARELIHFATGLLKALGTFYNEDISVYRIDKDRIKVFLKSIHPI
jgi:hypothetical protein